ncbi:hypothetical protein GCM10023149_23290 [Mucilaginibacter gynuensis]|uniref:PA14 domain-containing protein n=1 Tax=Mucilaginibacter gynuensis TaxID=1302236 RepID=A0ABP8GEX0_9SPHI
MNRAHFLALFSVITIWLLKISPSSFAQSANKQLVEVGLTDLSAFTNPAKNWQLAGDVHMDIEKDNTIKTTKGTGVLVNVSDGKNQGQDLVFNIKHGDIDIEFDYMVARSAVSCIYLQGIYKVQLADSWGITEPKANDNGGIYEGWDAAQKQGLDGHSPRQNVSRAPGLWQHIKIAFRAPRFNTAGAKVENPKILLVELNGIRIQEDVELSGTSAGTQEVAAGPLRLQGDGGAIAFRNIKYSLYDKPRPEISNLKYAVYKGSFENEPDYSKLHAEAEGTSTTLSSNFSPLQNAFVMHYTGNLNIKQAGSYSFNLSVPGGSGLMRISNNVVVPIADWKSTGSAELKEGIIPFDIYYSKQVDWAKPALGLSITGPGIREFLISDANVSSNDAVDPILINVTGENMLMRCFIDINDSKRVTHAINVGSNKQVHYTYDADNGSVVQVWRGGFLDATPMWHERGDGSSRPTGAVLQFGEDIPAIQKLNTTEATLANDTTGSGFKPKGYSLGKDKRPLFRYAIYGTTVTDATSVLNSGQGVQRVIELQDAQKNLYFHIATVNNVEVLGNGWYLIDDKSWYLHVEEGEAKTIIKNNGSKKEILVPISKKLTYSVLF